MDSLWQSIATAADVALHNHVQQEGLTRSPNAVCMRDDLLVPHDLMHW